MTPTRPFRSARAHRTPVAGGTRARSRHLSGETINRNRPRGWKRRIVAIAATLGLPLTLAVAAPAPPASAYEPIPCIDRTTAQPFARWGDTRNYHLLHGGSFEPGSPNWAMFGNAGIGNGNSPWYVWGGGSKSLWLGPGGTVVAPSFCATVNMPYIRFFYLATPEQNARLKVTLTIWRGSTSTSRTYWLPGGSGRWQVSDALAIPDVSADGWRTVSVKFEAVNSSTAQWLVDDFSVDPWKSLR